MEERATVKQLSVRRLGFAMGMLLPLLYAVCMVIMMSAPHEVVVSFFTAYFTALLMSLRLCDGKCFGEAALKAKEFLSAKTQNQHIKSI